jgi:hypothetical protein
VGAGDGTGTLAQEAVEAALLQDAGVPIASQPSLRTTEGLPSWARPAGDSAKGPPPATGLVYGAARRFAALPAMTRHAWLTTPTTPWVWAARPPHDLGGALCAALLLVAGTAAVTLTGARDSGRRAATD